MIETTVTTQAANVAMTALRQLERATVTDTRFLVLRRKILAELTPIAESGTEALKPLIEKYLDDPTGELRPGTPEYLAFLNDEAVQGVLTTEHPIRLPGRFDLDKLVKLEISVGTIDALGEADLVEWPDE